MGESIKYRHEPLNHFMECRVIWSDRINGRTLDTMKTTIFVTGATGCIGHYVLDELHKSFPDAQVHALVRDQGRFKGDIGRWPNLICHPGSMDDIGQYKAVLQTCDHVIHIATVWGYDLAVNLRINRDRTMEMLNYLDPERVKKIIYFSTASILTKGNVVSPAARSEGTPYIQSKLAGYEAIKASKWANKVVTLFPTMVLGGDKSAPYSHISQGVLDIRRYLWWARWVKLHGAFHFLHAEDIAKMVTIGIQRDDIPHDMVIGVNRQTFNATILAICKHLKKTPWIQLSIPAWLIRVMVWALGSRVESWGAHCAKHPYFEYDTHAPTDFGVPIRYPTFQSVLDQMETI